MDKIRKIFKKSITLLILPHSGRPPIRLTISIPFLISMVLAWSTLTIWSGYIASRHIDYLKSKLDKQMLRLKFLFLAHNLKKYKNLLQTVEENDQKLRELIGLKTKERVIQSGKGGPSIEDAIYLEKLLEKRIHELDYKEMKRQLDLLKAEIDLRLKETNETLTHVKTLQKMFRSVPIGWPVKNKIVSPYGLRIHPVYKRLEFHEGIDIDGYLNAPIRATADGVVVFTGWEHGYGKLVIVKHDFDFLTYYAHLNKIVVKEGQKVKRGDIIGLMGDTGTTTGIHLHYEIRKNKKSINPYYYLTPDGFYRREMAEYVRQNKR